MKIQPQLGKPITRMRGMTARGLATGKSAIDRVGGKMGAGLIRGFAVVTRGEALGHGVWLDRKFVQQTRVAINGLKKGAKSRFTHPGMSADGMGKLLGRAYRGVEDGDLLRSDLHFSMAAHKAPDGDLASYVMDLADEDPEAFGSSIVYMPDFEAERDFFVKHGGKFIADPYYGEIADASEFKSPDELNEKNLPHARLSALHAVDIVDEPAANPSGMFGRDPVFADAEKLMLFLAGVEKHAPQLSSLSVDPKRVTYFFTNFLDRHGLQLSAKPKPPEESDMKTFSAEDINRYVTAFGAQGATWLAEGKEFPECEKLHSDASLAALKAEKEASDKKHAEALAAADKKHADELAAAQKERDEFKAKADAAAKLHGEVEPVSFNDADKGAADKPLKSALGDRLGAYAESLKLSKN